MREVAAGCRGESMGLLEAPVIEHLVSTRSTQRWTAANMAADDASWCGSKAGLHSFTCSQPVTWLPRVYWVPANNSFEILDQTKQRNK
ncbi:MAG: hypothetical protein CBB71_04310 [Rhodopirellula sp. TMED11]|nr:MAG: hypothetical protein CBB71_04310 [Rhodopirellula sp. TMED11]